MVYPNKPTYSGSELQKSICNTIYDNTTSIVIIFAMRVFNKNRKLDWLPNIYVLKLNKKSSHL